MCVCVMSGIRGYVAVDERGNVCYIFFLIVTFFTCFFVSCLPAAARMLPLMERESHKLRAEMGVSISCKCTDLRAFLIFFY